MRILKKLNHCAIFGAQSLKLSFIIDIFYFAFFIFLIKKWAFFKTSFLRTWGFVFVFLAKVALGIFLWEIHIQYFGDAYCYLTEASKLNSIFNNSPVDYFKLLSGFKETLSVINKHIPDTIYWTNSGIYNDAKNTIRFNAIIQAVSFHQIYVQIMWMSLLSMIALKSIYDCFVFHSHSKKAWIFFAIMLFPSISFWSASFLKESYLLLGFGLFLKACFSSYRLKFRILHLCMGTFFLLTIKPYVLVCLLPCLVFYYAWKKIKTKTFTWSVSLLFLSLLSMLFLAKIILIHPVKIISRKQADFMNVGKGGLYLINDSSFYYFNHVEAHDFHFLNGQAFLQKQLKGEIIHFGDHRRETFQFQPNKIPWDIYYQSEQSGSFISVTPINESLGQLLKNIPQAISNTLFRPYPNDPPFSKGKWMILAETWFIFLFLFFGIARRPQLTKEKIGLIISLVLFACFLSTLIGWIVPVIGAIIRYRIPITLVFLFIGFLLWESPRKSSSLKNRQE